MRRGFRVLFVAALALTLVWSAAAWAATVGASGSVTDSAGQPMTGVRVELRDTSDRAVAAAETDTHGRFTIQAPEAGVYSLVAKKTGAGSASEVVTLPSGADKTLSETLAPDEGPDVTIEGRRLPRGPGFNPGASTLAADSQASRMGSSRRHRLAATSLITHRRRLRA